MKKWNTNDPKFRKRVIEVYQFQQATATKLKRHYKWSNRKIDTFMQDVFDYLLTDGEMTVEDAVKHTLEVYNDRQSSSRPSST